MKHSKSPNPILASVLAGTIALTSASPAAAQSPSQGTSVTPGTPASGRPSAPGSPSSGGSGSNSGGPVVTPRPQPTPRPAPPSQGGGSSGGSAPSEPSIDTREAQVAGREDGSRDGANEGQERGNSDGIRIGGQTGLTDGRARCEEERSRDAYTRGFNEGAQQGQREGLRAGHEAGLRDGSERGNRDGTSDGRRQADEQAAKDAQDPGSQEGTRQANQSDATQRGQRDGTERGNRTAQERANTVDYEESRRAQRAILFAETIQNNDSFSQQLQAKTSAGFSVSFINQVKKIAKLALGVSGLRGLRGDIDLSQAEVIATAPKKTQATLNYQVPDPDFRFYNDSRSWPTADETSAYRQEYQDSYLAGYRQSYMDRFDISYRQSYGPAEQAGCALANQLDYRPAFNQGFAEGRDQAYRQNYEAQFASSADAAYRAAFAPAAKAEYLRTYPEFYKTHFERARQNAYAQRVDTLYQASLNQASATRYAQVYPGYAQAARQRAQQDEIADFQQRPLRLVDTAIVETIPNGNYEPGETLRFKLKLRNFGNSAIRGKDVKIELVSTDTGLVLAQARSELIRDLKPKSLTEVRDALEFKLTEALTHRAAKARLVVTHLNQSAGEQSYSLTAEFQTDLKLDQPLSLKEGIPTEMTLTVTNRSDKPTADTSIVRLLLDSEKISVRRSTAELGALLPGQSRKVSFMVTARTLDTEVRVPIAVEVLDSALDRNQARRIGLVDLSGSVPVLNDYRIQLTSPIDSLRSPGVTRAQYKIVNVSSRLLFRGLQLKARILDRAGNEVTSALLVGPNPQFLKPVKRGESVTFVLPMVNLGARGTSADSLNGGGILELEVQEDGTTVVVHQAKF